MAHHPEHPSRLLPPNWSAQERMAVFWAKLIGVVLQHWLLLMSTWSEPRRSLAKAAQVIREWIPSLTQALRKEMGSSRC
jgi:hypothetical protein